MVDLFFLVRQLTHTLCLPMSAGSNVLAHLLQWPRLSKFVLLILSFSLHRWQTLKFPDLTLSFNLADLSSPVMIEASRGPEQCTHFPCAALLAFLVLKFSRHDGHKTNFCWSAGISSPHRRHAPDLSLVFFCQRRDRFRCKSRQC